MFSEIQERLAGSVAALSEVRPALMRRLRNTASTWRMPSWKDLRRGVSVDFVLALVSLAMFTALIWGFEYVDRLYDRVVMSLIPAAFPPVVFFESMRQKLGDRRFRWETAGIALFVTFLLGLAFSDKFDLYALRITLFVMIMSSPWLVIWMKLVRDERILAIGMVPAAIILMAYWVAPAIPNDSELFSFLGPVVPVSFLTALWTFLVWIFLKGVRKWTDHPTLSPLMESLAMLLLFMPLMVLAIWAPRAIPGGGDWSVVLAAMVGVVFGSVVSEPLRRFLRSYGDLPSHRRRGGSNEVEQGQDTGGRSRE